MESNSSDPLPADVQETQFVPPAQVEQVINDEFTRPVRTDLEQHDTITPIQQELGADNSYGTIDIVKSQSEPIALVTVTPRILAPDLLRGLLMVLMAIDHASVTSTAYAHGQAIVSEGASTRLNKWNSSGVYVVRTLSHLCAPGFAFLLGMGVVYFGRSRSKLGWSALQMIRHFFIRAVVIILVNQLIGLFAMGRFFPLLNIVLWALAIDYFITGLLWLAITWTESRLTRVVAKIIPDPPPNPDTSPLLQPNSSTSKEETYTPYTAAQVSFHLHNAVILMLALVTVWWNIWFDPHQGQCPPTSEHDPPQPTNMWFEFFFHMLMNRYMISAFPPLAWLAPAIFGLLYARIVLSRRWKPDQLNLGNLVTGLALLLLFVFTRLFHFGNLEEDCFAMPEHVAHPDQNQYLTSPRAFFYITKYPPSPAFIFFTIGANLVLLSLLGFLPAKASKRFPFTVLLVFGTSALFFYTLHLLLYSMLGTLAKQLFGHKMNFDDSMHPGRPAWGIGFGIVFWFDYFLGLLICWPVCRWYGNFKASKGPDSIWRFF